MSLKNIIVEAKIIEIINGGKAISKFLIKYLYANAPNNAAKAESKPGFNVSDCKTGDNKPKQATPRAKITVVTIVEVAIDTVETISPS